MTRKNFHAIVADYMSSESNDASIQRCSAFKDSPFSARQVAVGMKTDRAFVAILRETLRSSGKKRG